MNDLLMPCKSEFAMILNKVLSKNVVVYCSAILSVLGMLSFFSDILLSQ